MTGGLALLQVSADPDAEVASDAVVPVLAVTTVLGALVGAVVGSRIADWQVYDLHPALSVDPDAQGAGAQAPPGSSSRLAVAAVGCRRVRDIGDCSCQRLVRIYRLVRFTNRPRS